MQRLQMNPRWEWGLISQIKSYLAFSFSNFPNTTLLQLGVPENSLKRLLTWSQFKKAQALRSAVKET